jgi:hypothetical protein
MVGVGVVQDLHLVAVVVGDGHDGSFGGTYGGVHGHYGWRRTHHHLGRSFVLHPDYVDGACHWGGASSCAAVDAVGDTCTGYMGQASALLARGYGCRRHESVGTRVGNMPDPGVGVGNRNVGLTFVRFIRGIESGLKEF